MDVLGKWHGIVARSGGGTLYSIELKGTLEAGGHSAALLVSRVSVYPYDFGTPLTFTDVSTEYDGALIPTTDQATEATCAEYKHIIVINP